MTTRIGHQGPAGQDNGAHITTIWHQCGVSDPWAHAASFYTLLAVIAVVTIVYWLWARKVTRAYK